MPDPRNELSVRITDVGGGVNPNVRLVTNDNPFGHSRVVLLVHGYANAVKDARGSYDTFLTNYANQWPARSPDLNNFFKFYWPGDKNWGPLRVLAYPLEIKPSKDSAKVLARYLSGLWGPSGTPIQIFFVGHSLGNRLVLEALRELKSGPVNSLVEIRYVCLMAAAVPVSKVDTNGELCGAALFTHTCILYSPDDLVLHLAFPIGETLALDAFFPRAVGRLGEPARQWTVSQQMAGYGHSDYWPSQQTTLPVGNMLGLPTDNQIAASAIPARPLPAAAAPPPPQIPARATESRPPFG